MAFREWLNSWTFFNWLTLIAFTMATMLFLPSAISHWLNLYPKFKNWRATKSKEKFEWRIKELEMQIYKASKYKNAPKIFFIELLDDAIHPLSALLFAFLLFLFVCLVLLNSIQSNFVAVYQLTATILSFCS
ncbi:MAG: hypothetical protein M3Q33_05720 [Acidobacteriota bacterium]|nr:hypothetical protein [Acidobacteriota bacterium]